MIEILTGVILIAAIAVGAVFLALTAVVVALLLGLRARIPQGVFKNSAHGSTHV
ncbi:hypothetical protein [Rhodococcus artemisiae]|uniref:Uncharacterized protein n=1 Tax=Rhodococcus artemisiae TaxID=714159 RepID=A0ABU7LED9_9NOCA|nr:hypothetical protein [Rhodococcus artemisiae]MEE2059654.1 hypothetical protein [Rhodococcus artemisiae]